MKALSGSLTIGVRVPAVVTAYSQSARDNWCQLVCTVQS